MTRVQLTGKSYEYLLSLLRSATLSGEDREVIMAELKSRDRVMQNQWAEVCGGQFR